MLDASQYDDYVEEISDEYEEIREEHYENLKVIPFRLYLSGLLSSFAHDDN